MPMPEGAQLNFGYSPLLTTVAVNLLPKLDQYIGRKLFPSVGVATPTGVYNKFSAGDFLRRHGKALANYEASPVGGFSSSQQSFSVTNWGVATAYTQREMADARRGGQTTQGYINNKTRWVVTQGVLEQEFRIQNLIQTTGNWTTTKAGVAAGPVAGQFVAWDQTAATPVDDVKGWKREMRLLTGYEPNTMVIPEKIMLALFKNAQIQGRVNTALTGANGGKPVDVEASHVQSLFGMTILTPKGVWNSAQEGQTQVLADIWTQTIVWIGYVADSVSIDQPSAGYLFNWTGDTTQGLPDGIGAGPGPNTLGGVMNNEGLFIRSYVENRPPATFIDGELWASPNVVCADMGLTLTATIS